MLKIKEYNRELQKYKDIPFNEFDGFMIEFMNWLIAEEKEPFEEWIKDVCHESYLTKDIPEEYLKNLSERNIYHQIKEKIINSSKILSNKTPLTLFVEEIIGE